VPIRVTTVNDNNCLGTQSRGQADSGRSAVVETLTARMELEGLQCRSAKGSFRGTRRAQTLSRIYSSAMRRTRSTTRRMKKARPGGSELAFINMYTVRGFCCKQFYQIT